MLLLAAAAVVWMLTTFSSILFLLFISILLAVAITPLINRMEERKVPRSLAIIIIYILLIAVASLAIGLLIPVLIEEINQLRTNLPGLVRSALDLPARWITPYFPSAASSLEASNIAQTLSDQIGGLVGGVGALVLTIGSLLTSLLISTFLVLVIGFFLTSDARFAPTLIARFFPPSARTTAAELAREIGRRLGHWVRAQLLVGLFYGTTFGIGLALMGVPYAFSLGVAGAILELIPYVGGAIVTALAMLVALAISPWLSLGVLVWEIIVANIESHVVYPKVVGDIVGLHPLVIIIALFIGAEAQGVMGALLALPVAIVIQVLFERFYRFEEATEAEERVTLSNLAPPQVAVPRPAEVPGSPARSEV
jgi:predicted PurR-regulated permease PerM